MDSEEKAQGKEKNNAETQSARRFAEKSGMRIFLLCFAGGVVGIEEKVMIEILHGANGAPLRMTSFVVWARCTVVLS